MKEGFQIWWGLNEKDHPPPLVSPRPKGIFFDDDMNEYLLNTPFEQILYEISRDYNSLERS